MEEGSKFWILWKCKDLFLRSINDFLRFAIVIAIGFAFAENILMYDLFLEYVHQYLNPDHLQVGMFILVVIGRIVCITVVHAVSTGIVGYYFGMAFFATPLLQEKSRKQLYTVLTFLQRIVNINAQRQFRIFMICQGLLFASLLHGLFDCILSVLDVVIAQEERTGATVEFLGMHVSHTTMLYGVSACIVLYIIAGLKILASLLQSTENQQNFDESLIFPTPTKA